MLTAEVARSSILLMRRVTADHSIRRPSNVARVRRVLFDEPLNHEETRRDLLKETEQLSSEMRQRWNFDFESESPLQGRYEWQRTVDSVHPAYELRNLSTLSAPASSIVPGSSNSDSHRVRPELKSEPVSEKLIVKSESGSPSTKSKSALQKKMTDFMTQRKRPLLKSATAPVPSPKNKVRRTTTT